MHGRGLYSSLPVVLVALFVGACGGSTDGGGAGNGSAPDPIPRGEFLSRTASAVCDKHLDCCSSKELTGLRLPTSRTACTSELESTYDSFLGPYLNAEGTGYDGRAAASCLKQYRERGCEVIPGSDADAIPVCQDSLQPQVETGGTCTVQPACREGYCSGSGGDEGVCKAPGGRGDSCPIGTSARSCETDLYCISETCQPRKENGESCTLDLNCKSGRCAIDGNSETCQPKIASGGSCTANSDCGSGVCHGGGENSEGSCLPAPVCDGD